MTIERFAFAWLVTTVAACIPSPVSTVRAGGVYPANPPSCPLELRLGTATNELVANYTMIGTISVKGEMDESANAPRLLALLKPEACGLGGEVVLLVASHKFEPRTSGERSSQHSYLVYRKNGAAPPSQMF